MIVLMIVCKHLVLTVAVSLLGLCLAAVAVHLVYTRDGHLVTTKKKKKKERL